MPSMFLCATNLFVIYSTMLQGSVVHTADGVQCPTNWFGNNCSFMCHCTNPQDCDKDGSCKNGSCINSMFGPGCQYVDLLSLHGAPWNPHYLTDANDETCSDDEAAHIVSVSLSRPMTFLWFRINVKDADEMTKFTVKLNIVEPCSNERRFILNEREMDVSCDTTILLRTLELRGDLAQTICSIRISGGRNVALKQPTAQSSTKSLKPGSSTSDLAVDGNTNQDYFGGSCIQTEQENEGPSWAVFFNRQQILIRAVMYNRIRGNDRNFIGNTLETYDIYDELASYSKVPNVEISGIYEIMMVSPGPVLTVQINRPPNIALYERVLNLCEVQLFGETICPEDRFGLDCEKECTCEADEICSTVTGVCVSGCQHGKYGFNCSLTCSETCAQGICKSRLGGCVNCVPGYTGEECDEECPEDMYGENCEFDCSENCQEMCDFQTGVCQCVGNFSEPLCNDCMAGLFGENCTEECPDLCHNHVCDRYTGACFRCQGLRQGPFCEDCPPQFYGSLCYTKCSSYCGNGTCDKEDGKCSDCTQGYEGQGCTIAPKKPFPWHYLIPLPLVIGMICLGTILLLRKRRRQQQHESGESDYGEEDL